MQEEPTPAPASSSAEVEPLATEESAGLTSRAACTNDLSDVHGWELQRRALEAMGVEPPVAAATLSQAGGDFAKALELLKAQTHDPEYVRAALAAISAAAQKLLHDGP